MIAKPIGAILAAILVSLSGTVGSFHFVGAQDQGDQLKTGPAEITLSNIEASPGSTVAVNGSNFGANSQVSIYFMSSQYVNFSSGSAFILEGIRANRSSTAEQEGNGNFFDEDALKTLEDLLQSGNLLVALKGEAPNNGRMSLECHDKKLAEGGINGNIVTLAVHPGMYNECLISISDGNITNTGKIGNLKVVSDAGEEYRNSAMTSVSADEQGAFQTSVIVPDVEEGEYAVLAVGSNRTASVSTLSVTIAQAETETENNDNTTAANSTTIGVTNETSTQTPEENVTRIQNQTQNNQTGTSTEPTVQVDETGTEPGSPLAIRGEGFQPDTPIQIFINNVQITNVITNVGGSFNTVVIVPTTVNAGNAKVVVRTEQTNIVENVNIIQRERMSEAPSMLDLIAASATDNNQVLRGAPVTIIDASNGQLIESGQTPMEIRLQQGTYSIFYSDFGLFDFDSARPGRWIHTPDGGSGLITIREGSSTTVTAMYNEQPMPPPPPPKQTENSLTLRLQGIGGNQIPSMFTTIYNATTGQKLDQGFTELRVDHLRPGTYPIFFGNFKEFVFLSASPGSWVQTPFGGVGVVTIPDDGEDHNIAVTSLYNRTTVEEEQFKIQLPLDLHGQIFSITSNQTYPQGPFVISGSFALTVGHEEPVNATLSAYIMSAREDSNENVDLELQRSRHHDTFQVVDFKPQVARPLGLNSYVISGTADLLLNGNMYSNNEGIVVIVKGGEALAPTDIEIYFRGAGQYSAANRLETLYGVVSSGFQ